MNKIILASASPRRRELLAQIGLAFEVMPGSIEEKTTSRKPWEMVMELSAMKAEEIFNRLSYEERSMSIVVGADTVVALGERIMGKPGSEKEAENMLTLLQGNSHQVYTGVTLVWDKEGEGAPAKVSFYEKTEVVMCPMSSQEIKAYVATGEPMDKAGAYGIQGKCAPFIREIHGDYYNVVGLPISRLYQEIKKISIKDVRP